ncbi:hypothetical protein VVD49_19210 [Uliginosibacterium sp. H3]|uniref:Uncharacterized protein n=1 Tax=Uliginosibacterium silvisoli TaxID=3114758 RepID=A0ABU6KAA5_9RHOO|nr:hypothetical protein [Uliginosibacterium sp. H3]
MNTEFQTMRDLRAITTGAATAPRREGPSKTEEQRSARRPAEKRSRTSARSAG